MLDAGIYEQLSRLVIAMKQKSSQNMAGNRRSVQKGTSAEFSDFREYMPGDDLRRLDWNVYARLDKMYIREYMEEKEISTKEEIEKMIQQYDIVNDLGIKCVHYQLALNVLAKIAILSLVCFWR